MITNGDEVLIRFTVKGRWAENLSYSSVQFDVVSGQQRMVSMVLGNMIVKAGKGEYVEMASKGVPDPIKTTGPVSGQHAGPVGNEQTGPVPKAEAEKFKLKKPKGR